MWNLLDEVLSFISPIIRSKVGVCSTVDGVRISFSGSLGRNSWVYLKVRFQWGVFCLFWKWTHWKKPEKSASLPRRRIHQEIKNKRSSRGVVKDYQLSLFIEKYSCYFKERESEEGKYIKYTVKPGWGIGKRKQYILGITLQPLNRKKRERERKHSTAELWASRLFFFFFAVLVVFLPLAKSLLSGHGENTLKQTWGGEYFANSFYKGFFLFWPTLEFPAEKTQQNAREVKTITRKRNLVYFSIIL